MLNAAGRFRAAAAAPIFLNLSMIVFLSLAQLFPSPAHAVSYGVLVAGALELAFIVWAAARTGLALRFGVPRWNAEMRDFMSALGFLAPKQGRTLVAGGRDTILEGKGQSKNNDTHCRQSKQRRLPLAEISAETLP